MLTRNGKQNFMYEQKLLFKSKEILKSALSMASNGYKSQSGSNFDWK